jgi:TPR repeat protein
MNGLGVEKDETKAFKLFKNAANSGNMNAQYQTGTCYETGSGCAADFGKAKEFYEMAARQGDSPAMDRLGVLYYQGGPGLRKDEKQSFEWFLRAASFGIVDSMFAVGCFYAEGFGTSKNLKEARKWLKLAADNGHKEAAEALASIESS